MLTTNGIRDIVHPTTDDVSTDQSLDPLVLQLISINQRPPINGVRRYNVVLSDGSHFITGFLASSLSQMVQENQLQYHDIISLEDFDLHTIQGHHAIIVKKLSVLANLTYRIGDPIDINQADLSNGAIVDPTMAQGENSAMDGVAAGNAVGDDADHDELDQDENDSPVSDGSTTMFFIEGMGNLPQNVLNDLQRLNPWAEYLDELEEPCRRERKTSFYYSNTRYSILKIALFFTLGTAFNGMGETLEQKAEATLKLIERVEKGHFEALYEFARKLEMDHDQPWRKHVVNKLDNISAMTNLFDILQEMKNGAADIITETEHHKRNKESIGRGKKERPFRKKREARTIFLRRTIPIKFEATFLKPFFQLETEIRENWTILKQFLKAVAPYWQHLLRKRDPLNPLVQKDGKDREFFPNTIIHVPLFQKIEQFTNSMVQVLEKYEELDANTLRVSGMEHSRKLPKYQVPGENGGLEDTFLEKSRTEGCIYPVEIGDKFEKERLLLAVKAEVERETEEERRADWRVERHQPGQCKHDGCQNDCQTNEEKRLGFCDDHRRCTVEGCGRRIAFVNRLCTRHHFEQSEGTPKQCKHDGCQNDCQTTDERKFGFCDDHRGCTVEGCSKRMNFGDRLCTKHHLERTPKQCKHDGCQNDCQTFDERRLSFCDEHRRCTVEGCSKRMAYCDTLCKKHHKKQKRTRESGQHWDSDPKKRPRMDTESATASTPNLDESILQTAPVVPRPQDRTLGPSDANTPLQQVATDQQESHHAGSLPCLPQTLSPGDDSDDGEVPKPPLLRLKSSGSYRSRDAFASSLAQHSGNDEHLENVCAFGTECDVYKDPATWGVMSTKYGCHNPDCHNEVHHTCSWKFGVGEHQNDCCCSKECYKKFKRLKR